MLTVYIFFLSGVSKKVTFNTYETFLKFYKIKKL